MIIGDHAYMFLTRSKTSSRGDTPKGWKTVDTVIGEHIRCGIFSKPLSKMGPVDHQWHRSHGQVPAEWHRDLVIPGVPVALVTPVICPKCGERVMDQPQMEDDRQRKLAV